MKNIKIPYIGDAAYSNKIAALSLNIDAIAQQKIDQASWIDYPYSPQVSFAIAYTRDCILLKYYVEEESVKAKYSCINDPVYEDSCVEFFVAVNDAGYYNFEFNCLGTCLAAHGRNRTERDLLPASTISRIKVMAVIDRSGPEKDRPVDWQLTVVIPFDVFSYDDISTLQGKRCRGNFYKCGDGTSQPHFLSWNAIRSEMPDFHQPGFFGFLDFS